MELGMEAFKELRLIGRGNYGSAVLVEVGWGLPDIIASTLRYFAPRLRNPPPYTNAADRDR
jgi:hypothetical protein